MSDRSVLEQHLAVNLFGPYRITQSFLPLLTRSRGAIINNVSLMVAGWALAQAPTLLRGLTIEQAAASHDTLVAVIVAIVAGAVILFPSLALLFGLVLRGALDHAQTAPRPVRAGRMLVAASTPGLLARLAGACLVAGIGFTTIANAGWAHAIGVASLLAFIAIGFPAALPPDILTSRQSEGSAER